MNTSTLERPTHTGSSQRKAAAPASATARTARRTSLGELLHLAVNAAHAARTADARGSVAVASRFAESIRA